MSTLSVVPQPGTCPSRQELRCVSLHGGPPLHAVNLLTLLRTIKRSGALLVAATTMPKPTQGASKANTTVTSKVGTPTKSFVAKVKIHRDSWLIKGPRRHLIVDAGLTGIIM